MQQIVKLWTNDQSPVPSVEVEADHLYEAAALGLKHFQAIGHQLLPDATVNVESVKFGVQPRRVREVIDWLRNSEEGKAFVDSRRLHSLLD
jgi:hypothetical protein